MTDKSKSLKTSVFKLEPSEMIPPVETTNF